MRSLASWMRAPLALAAALALVSGVLAGLVRAGWPWPVPAAAILGHGPLLAVGFFGTLIGLERAVAIGHAAAAATPALAALSALAILSEHPSAPFLASAAGVAAVLIHAWLLARARTADLAMLALGALAWCAGSVAWMLGRPVADASLGWSAFLVLTIVGERLELTRLLPPRRGRGPALALATSALVVGSLLVPIAPSVGVIVRGVALSALGVWLLAYDAVLHVRAPSTSRYVKTALALGHPWLVIAGPLAIIAGPASGGLLHDAALHAVYVGFVLGMVFAHAPIVLPAVLRLRFAPGRALFVPLALLHLSVAARIAGDLAGAPGIRRTSTLAHVVALVMFASIAIVSIASQRGAHRAPRPLHPEPERTP